MSLADHPDHVSRAQDPVVTFPENRARYREHCEHSPTLLTSFGLALVAGTLSAFAFQPVGLWPLMPLAFAGLCELVGRAPSMKRALLVGWSFGVGQFVLGLNWIATAFTYQAAMPAWLGRVAVVLLSLYLAVYPMLAVGLAWRFGQASRLALVLALAGGWAVTEYLRATIFTGFSWNPVGVAFADTPWLNAIRFIGTFGLSVTVVLVGGSLWLLARRSWRTGGTLLALLLVLLALPPAEEHHRLTNFGPGSAAPRLSSPAIRIVQPNIGQEDKWREGLADEAFTRLANLSSGGAPPPRLLFWPEVAVPEPFQILDQQERPLPYLLPAIPRAVRSVRSGDVLLTGAFALIADDQDKIVGNTNSVFGLDAAGRVLGRYDKAHLVPYGEYLPMRPLLSAIGLSQLAPGQGDTIYGPGPRTLELGAFGRAGIQVCYEIIFSGEVVDRRNRPDFIFNPSNDAWFGAWGPPQHLAQARLRAAEEGLPVVRSTPTGISALVDARGQLLHSIPWRTAGVIDSTLPPPADPTLFSRTGNWLPMLLAVLLLLSAVVVDGQRRYRRT
ncbi:apolipoprotein N-acyltransferase [Sphingomonas sp. GCM10030256]|uniref:apolipoprotein N-acyltransferase n=1 Tax=Sphingomonas sp. GCM10030256 TaxID=3273427 RepID=UPI003605C9FB